jgi:hypothetical protein
MQKTKTNTALAIFFVATAVVLVGGLAVIPAAFEQKADAKVNTKVDGDCTARSGGSSFEDAGHPSLSGGDGGRQVTCTDGDSVNQGGRGGHTVTNTGESIQGGEGFRCQDNFLDTEPGECVGGGPGGANPD